MDPRVRHVAVIDAPLSVDRILQAVLDPLAGGVGLFVGVVRNHDEGADVDALDYSAHPSATEVLTSTAESVCARHDVIAAAAEHRVGSLLVGDLAVVVAVSAVHRDAALTACRELIDELKSRVPIWKHQHFTSGDATWVGL